MRKIPGTQDGVEGSVSDLNNISASLKEAEQDEACGGCSDSWLSLAHLPELVSVVSGSEVEAHDRGMDQSAWQK